MQSKVNESRQSLITPDDGGKGSDQNNGIPPEVASRAVEWLVELQASDATEATWQALQHWRNQHPDHECAWQRIEAVNCKLKGLAVSPTEAAAVHAALVLPLSLGCCRAVKTLTALPFVNDAV